MKYKFLIQRWCLRLGGSLFRKEGAKMKTNRSESPHHMQHSERRRNQNPDTAASHRNQINPTYPCTYEQASILPNVSTRALRKSCFISSCFVKDFKRRKERTAPETDSEFLVGRTEAIHNFTRLERNLWLLRLCSSENFKQQTEQKRYSNIHSDASVRFARMRTRMRRKPTTAPLQIASRRESNMGGSSSLLLGLLLEALGNSAIK